MLPYFKRQTILQRALGHSILYTLFKVISNFPVTQGEHGKNALIGLMFSLSFLPKNVTQLSNYDRANINFLLHSIWLKSVRLKAMSGFSNMKFFVSLRNGRSMTYSCNPLTLKQSTRKVVSKNQTRLCIQIETQMSYWECMCPFLALCSYPIRPINSYRSQLFNSLREDWDKEHQPILKNPAAFMTYRNSYKKYLNHFTCRTM